MDDPKVWYAIGGAVLLIAVLLLIARAILRRPLLLFLIGCGLVVAGATLHNSGFYWSAAVVALLWMRAVKLHRQKRLEAAFDVTIAGVDAPRRKRPHKTPPQITHARMRKRCEKILGGKVDNPALLDDEVRRVMESKNFSDWSLAQNDTYYERATPRQVGYLRAIGYTGKDPRYLGDASFLIESMLAVKSYRSKLRSGMPGTPPLPLDPDYKSDYVALWNAATAAGILSKRDAAELLKVVASAPESTAKTDLLAAYSDYLSSPEPPEIPGALHALGVAWLSSLQP